MYNVGTDMTKTENPKGKKCFEEHSNRQSHFDSFNKEMGTLTKAFTEWFSGFTVMNEELKKWDKAWKSFLHYDQKLRKLREERTKRKL